MGFLSKLLALFSLFLYIPGILLPAMKLEKMGRIRESSLFDSFSVLLNEHEWLLAAVVGLSALLLPPIKLMLLIWLEYDDSDQKLSRWKSFALDVMSRFGLLEVFISALFIALIRFDALLRFHACLGLYLFILSASCGLGAIFTWHLRHYRRESLS